jgi:predicted small lipoprotein YifL
MKRVSFFLACVLIVLIAVSALSGCGTAGPGESPDYALDIGQGDTVFRFEVTDDNEAVTAWNVHTDETTIGTALLGVDLIDGEMTAFGLYVETINGLTADYSRDQSWWAFFINGEMSMTGVSETEIEADAVYAFVYTKE